MLSYFELDSLYPSLHCFNNLHERNINFVRRDSEQRSKRNLFIDPYGINK